MAAQSRNQIIFVLLAIGALAVLIALPEILFRQNHTTAQAVAGIQIADRTNLFRQMVRLTLQSQRNLVNDYTFWDDMISFADGKLDDQWGAENIAAGIESFHVHGLWVVDRHGKVRYGVRGTPGQEPVKTDRLPIPLEEVEAAVARDTVAEFFRTIDGVTYSVMAAGIVPTADTDRATPPQGYFLTLNAIDNNLLTALGEQTGTTATLLPADTEPTSARVEDERTGAYSFPVSLADEHGQRVAVLRVEREDKALAALFIQNSRSRTLNRVLFTGLALLFLDVFYLLNRSRARAEKLAADMTVELRTVNATLEQKVAERTAALERDVAERTKTEAELRARTQELEKMNKVMIDRELRMVELKGELKKERDSEPPAQP